MSKEPRVSGDDTACILGRRDPGPLLVTNLLRHLDLRHLRQLIEIADKGSIRAAAVSLAITQPALSRSVRAIEADLGVRLIERGPQGAEVTAAGARLVKYARIIEANLLLADKELRGLKHASSQTEDVAFGMSWLTEAVIAAPLVERVIQERPGIRLRTSVGDYEALAPKLMSGRLDFFVGPPPVEGPVVGIATELLAEFRAGVIVRAGHPLTQRQNVSVAELVAASWVLPAEGTVPRITYDNCFLRHGAAAPEPVFEVQPLSPAIRPLLLDSDLVTILPRVFVQSDLDSGLLEELPFDEQIVFPIHLTRRQMNHPSPARDYVIARISRLFEDLTARRRRR